MTAAANPFAVSPVPVLPPDTAPTAIRDALIDEERAEFEHAYQEAIAEAAQTLDLTRVLDVLRNYHRIAWMTQRQGPKAHRRMLDKAAEILRTGENPDAVSGEPGSMHVTKFVMSRAGAEVSRSNRSIIATVTRRSISASSASDTVCSTSENRRDPAPPSRSG